MYTEPNMGLTIWNLLTDLYDHNAQANNLVAIGQHDHSSGKGVQIGTAGIANQAVTSGKITSGTITSTQIASNANILYSQLSTGAWTPLPITNPNLSPTFTDGSGRVSYSAASRIVGDKVELRGVILNTGGSTFAAAGTLCTLTTPFRPANFVYLTGQTFLGNGIMIGISHAGAVILDSDASGLLSGDFLTLDSLFYSLA